MMDVLFAPSGATLNVKWSVKYMKIFHPTVNKLNSLSIELHHVGFNPKVDIFIPTLLRLIQTCRTAGTVHVPWGLNWRLWYLPDRKAVRPVRTHLNFTEYQALIFRFLSRPLITCPTVQSIHKTNKSNKIAALIQVSITGQKILTSFAAQYYRHAVYIAV